MADHFFEVSTSASLIQRVRELDQAAWHVLCQLYGPVVYRWARRKGLQSQDASDVLQTVLMSIWRARATFQLDRPGSSFRGWLWAITLNAIREFYRKRQLHIASNDQLDEVTVVEHRQATEVSEIQDSDKECLLEVLFRALDLIRPSIEPSTWDAFWKTTVEELPVMEVATALGMTPAAVRQAKYRVLYRLRNLLADE